MVILPDPCPVLNRFAFAAAVRCSRVAVLASDILPLLLAVTPVSPVTVMTPLDQPEAASVADSSLAGAAAPISEGVYHTDRFVLC